VEAVPFLWKFSGIDEHGFPIQNRLFTQFLTQMPQSIGIFIILRINILLRTRTVDVILVLLLDSLLIGSSPHGAECARSAGLSVEEHEGIEGLLHHAQVCGQVAGHTGHGVAWVQRVDHDRLAILLIRLEHLAELMGAQEVGELGSTIDSEGLEGFGVSVHADGVGAARGLVQRGGDNDDAGGGVVGPCLRGERGKERG